MIFYFLSWSYVKQLFYCTMYRNYKTTHLQFDEILKSLGNSLQASENLPKPVKSLTTPGSRFLKAGSLPVW